MTEPPLEPVRAPAPEASQERLRNYAILAAITALIVACAIWAWWTATQTHRQAEASARAATRLCKQINQLGQACLAPSQDVPSGAAIVPALPAQSPTLTLLTPAPPGDGTPAPTRTGGGQEASQGQAYVPGAGTQITAITVQDGELILTFSDGARADAGPVDLTRLAFVLHGATETVISPSAYPSPSPSPSVTVSPSPSPSPEVPQDTWEPPDAVTPAAPSHSEETP